jgi:hypothetical protein
MISNAAERFSEDGELKDEDSKKFMTQLLDNLVDWTRRLQSPA